MIVKCLRWKSVLSTAYLILKPLLGASSQACSGPIKSEYGLPAVRLEELCVIAFLKKSAGMQGIRLSYSDGLR